MANTGSLTVTSGSKKKGVFTLSFTQSKNIATNKSTISFTFKMKTTSITAWLDYGSLLSYKIKIGGTSYSGNLPDYHGGYYSGSYSESGGYKPINSEVTIKTGTIEISHNSNGAANLYLEIDVTDSSGVNYTCGSAEGSKTVALDAIARASSINFAPTSVMVEDTVSINITKASSNFTHDLHWQLTKDLIPADGSKKTSAGWIEIVSSANLKNQTKFDWKIPIGCYGLFVTDNINETVQITIRCRTFSGTTLIGYQDKNLTLKLNKLKCAPELVSYSIDQSNILGEITRGDSKITIVDLVNGELKITPTYKYPNNYSKYRRYYKNSSTMINLTGNIVGDQVSVTQIKTFNFEDKLFKIETSASLKDLELYQKPKTTLSEVSYTFEEIIENSSGDSESTSTSQTQEASNTPQTVETESGEEDDVAIPGEDNSEKVEIPTEGNTTITSGFKIKELKFNINYNYLPFTKGSKTNKFLYACYCGASNPKELENSRFSNPALINIENGKGTISIQIPDNTVVLTSMQQVFYIGIRFQDEKTFGKEFEKKEEKYYFSDSAETKSQVYKIKPVFDWSSNDFKFNVPVEIELGQNSGEAWYDIVNDVGGGLNMNNSDITKVNSIYFNDDSDATVEGLCFPRKKKEGESYTYLDCLKVYNGQLQMIPYYNPSDTTKTEPSNIYYPAYRNKDSIHFNNNTVQWTGLITGGSTMIYLTIPLNRPVVAKKATLSGYIECRGVSGYVRTETSTAYIDLSKTTVNFVSSNPSGISFSITFSNKFKTSSGSNYQNNSPIVIEPYGNTSINEKIKGVDITFTNS